MAFDGKVKEKRDEKEKVENRERQRQIDGR